MAKLYTHTNKNATYSMVANLCVANKQSTRKIIKYCTIYLTIYMAVIMTVDFVDNNTGNSNNIFNIYHIHNKKGSMG